MLDNSRRDVLKNALLSRPRDFFVGAATTLVVRLTGIEALDDGDDEGDSTDEEGESAGDEGESVDHEPASTDA